MFPDPSKERGPVPLRPCSAAPATPSPRCVGFLFRCYSAPSLLSAPPRRVLGRIIPSRLPCRPEPANLTTPGGGLDGEIGETGTAFRFESLSDLHEVPGRPIRPPELPLQPRQPVPVPDLLLRDDQLSPNLDDAAARDAHQARMGCARRAASASAPIRTSAPRSVKSQPRAGKETLNPGTACLVEGSAGRGGIQERRRVV